MEPCRFHPKPAQNMLGAHHFAHLPPNGFSAFFFRKTTLALSISAIFGGNRARKGAETVAIEHAEFVLELVDPNEADPK
jgi:hypothetical protein